MIQQTEMVTALCLKSQIVKSRTADYWASVHGVMPKLPKYTSQVLNCQIQGNWPGGRWYDATPTSPNSFLGQAHPSKLEASSAESKLTFLQDLATADHRRGSRQNEKQLTESGKECFQFFVLFRLVNDLYLDLKPKSFEIGKSAAAAAADPKRKAFFRQLKRKLEYALIRTYKDDKIYKHSALKVSRGIKYMCLFSSYQIIYL